MPYVHSAMLGWCIYLYPRIAPMDRLFPLALLEDPSPPVFVLFPPHSLAWVRGLIAIQCYRINDTLAPVMMMALREDAQSAPMLIRWHTRWLLLRNMLPKLVLLDQPTAIGDLACVLLELNFLLSLWDGGPYELPANLPWPPQLLAKTDQPPWLARLPCIVKLELRRMIRTICGHVFRSLSLLGDAKLDWDALSIALRAKGFGEGSDDMAMIFAFLTEYLTMDAELPEGLDEDA